MRKAGDKADMIMGFIFFLHWAKARFLDVCGKIGFYPKRTIFMDYIWTPLK